MGAGVMPIPPESGTWSKTATHITMSPTTCTNDMGAAKTCDATDITTAPYTLVGDVLTITDPDMGAFVYTKSM